MSKLSDVWWNIKDRAVIKQISSNPDVFMLSAPVETGYIYVDIYANAGLLHEQQDTIGITHLLEHYILEKAFTDFGEYGEVNGDVTQERLHIYCKIREEKIGELLPRFISDIFSPAFSDQDILRQEQGAILSELSNDANNLERKIEKVIFNNRCNVKNEHFKSTLDAQHNITSLSLGDLEQWFNTVFNKKNVKIFFSCHRINSRITKSVATIIENLTLPDGKQLVAGPCHYSDKRIIIHNDASIQGTYLVISLPWITQSEHYTLKMSANFLLDSVFSWGQESLSQEVRDKGIYGLNYRLVRSKTDGLLVIYCNAPYDKIFVILEMVSKHFIAAKSRHIPKNRLDSLKQEAIAQHREGWRSNRRLDWIAEEIFLSIWNGGLKNDLKDIEGVTSDTIEQVANRYLDSRKANVILYGNIPDLESPDGLLQRLNF